MQKRLNGKSQGNLPEIKTVETIQWSWVKILIILRIIKDNYELLVWLGLYGIVHIISTTKLDINTIIVLSPILCVWLILVLIILLITGINISDIKETVVPNQGIWNSVINAVILAIIVSLFGALIAGLTFGTYKGLITGLSSGLIVGLWFGRCCAQHLILRIILSCSKLIPWNYARFLDYCTERLFLQRVGGRYRFIHRLLQEHFAAMPLEK